MSSPSPATGVLLWARALMLSAMALTTGALAHVQADGLLPGTTTLLVLTVAGAVACAPLLRREGSALRLVLLLVAGQSAVHMALAVTAGHRGDPVATPAPAPAMPTAATGDRTGSYFDAAYASRVGEHDGGLSVPAVVLHAFHDIAAHPMMALMHLLAAVACGLWLARGERALWLLVGLASRGWTELAASAVRRWAVAARAAVASALEVEVPTLAVAVATPLPQSQVASPSVSRRGPPLGA